jgi:hypothetical protein
MFLVPLEGHLRVDLRPLQRPVAESFGDDPDVQRRAQGTVGPSGQAACDKQRLTTDPRSIRRGQEDSGGGRDVLSLADPAEGGLRLELFAEVALRKIGGMDPFRFTIRD